MIKYNLNSVQTKALKNLKENLTLNSEQPMKGTYVGQLEIAYEITQCAKETVDFLEDSISDAITEVYDKNYGRSIERAEGILDELTMLKEQIKQIEEYAASAVLAIDKLTNKSSLTWVITDEKICEEINANDPTTKSLYLEHQDEEIHMVFAKINDYGEEEIFKTLLIATGNENDLTEAEQHINNILNNIG